MTSSIQGQIERITFHNEETGFSILRLKVGGYRELVTAVGNFLAPTPGQVIKATGEWRNHPVHGEQFSILQYTTMVPATAAGIEKYLGSGLIKGIGPVMAKRIVKYFGVKTLDVIERTSERLTEIEGIGQKRVGMIWKAWSDQKAIREVMVFLQGNGVSAAYATKIFKQYGDNSIEVVKENPYRLAMDIFGIGFVTADKIAESLGFDKSSEVRAEAGLIYVLHQVSDDGHVYYPQDLLVQKSVEMLGVNQEVIARALKTLEATRRIVIETIMNEDDLETQAVYLFKFHVSEKGVATRLGKLLRTPHSRRRIDVEKAINWVQDQLSISLADRQVEAVRSALDSKVMVITGGPGTGKTTIIKAILAIFERMGVRVLLAAPTGRAAKRMSEATERGARTIHRLLEFSPVSGGFQKNEENQLGCDLLILDEASMIDTALMFHLLKAIPEDATFIMVGDVNQLPSVGPGNVLKDVIESESTPVVMLDEIFRQARDSAIITNAHLVNRGSMPNLDRSVVGRNDFYFIEKNEPEDALRIILELACGRIQRAFGFDPVDDVQILTPMNRGLIGTANLNAELQKAINPREDGVIRGGRNYRINDKVMQIRNNYDKDVFNGDIGRISRVDIENQEVLISFDGRSVKYDYSELDEVALAYAVSVHKSQGSEYPCVIIPIMTQHYIMLQRNLLYTAITRGKKLVVIVGSKKALAIAVKNNRTIKRFSHLRQRLAGR